MQSFMTSIKSDVFWSISWVNCCGIPLRVIDSGDRDKDWITEAEFRKLLKQKTGTVKMDYVIKAIGRFIKNPKVLVIWASSYFHELSVKLKVK